MNATARRRPRVRMTIHVYRVDRNGTVIDDRGSVNVTDRWGQVPVRSVFPPCRCHRCAGRAGTR